VGGVVWVAWARQGVWRLRHVPLTWAVRPLHVGSVGMQRGARSNCGVARHAAWARAPTTVLEQRVCSSQGMLNRSAPCPWLMPGARIAGLGRVPVLFSHAVCS